MAGTKILQTWAIEDGAVTIHVRSAKPFNPEIFAALGNVIDAIETFAYSLTPATNAHVHSWVDITAMGDQPNQRYICNGCEAMKVTDSRGNQISLVEE